MEETSPWEEKQQPAPRRDFNEDRAQGHDRVEDELGEHQGRRLDAVQSSCTALSIVKQGGLMVVANVDDSRVVLDTASDDDAITPSSSSST
uniref:protein-serine/threonine phosphatase n=1 Tax=Zea mays TaxID=4577 RepID=A0A804NZB1_MAIZE